MKVGTHRRSVREVQIGTVVYPAVARELRLLAEGFSSYNHMLRVVLLTGLPLVQADTVACFRAASQLEMAIDGGGPVTVVGGIERLPGV